MTDQATNESSNSNTSVSEGYYTVPMEGSDTFAPQPQAQPQAQQPQAQVQQPQPQPQPQAQQPQAQVQQPQPQPQPQAQPQAQVQQAAFTQPQAASWQPVPASGYAFVPGYSSGAGAYASIPVTPQTPPPTNMPPVASVPAQPKRHGWIVAIVVVLAIFALLVVGVVSCTSLASSQMGAFDSADTSLDALSEDAIGVIDMSGTIQYDGTTCSPEGLKEQLDRAEENSHIKAVVLRVDSGGGTATAGEEMATYLKEFSKPVVVSTASINASAAYLVSSQADFIYVAKTSEIGAIGTAMQSVDYSGLLDKLGIKVDNITSSDSKDSSYGTRALTEDEQAYYQAMVDQINNTFIESVAEGRDMTVDEVKALATGLVFTGIDGVANGLADDFGTKEDAVAKAAELAGISSYTTVALEYTTSDISDLMSLLGYSSNSNDLAAALEELEGNASVSQ